MAKPKPTKMLAVLGRCRRTGRWRLASRSSVLAVFGKCHLDMTRSFVDDKEKLKMNVTVIFGSATFILPDGAEVRPSGMALLAASRVDVPDHDDTSDLPTLDIEWTCVFGRIRILSEDAVARLEIEHSKKQFDKAVKKAKKKGEPLPVAAHVVEVAAASDVVAKKTPKPAEEPEPTPVGIGFEDVAVSVDTSTEPAVAGVGFEDVGAPEPVVMGVGFEDVPAAAGVGFEDVPAADEPAVVGVGFEDVPAVEEAAPAVAAEPVIGGVGFDDMPASDEADPVVMGVGFGDIPEGESETDDSDADAVESAIRPSVDLGFVDMDYDPDWVPEPALAGDPATAE